LYGDGATDTILAEPAQALVVEVRGENGVPVSGTVVRFQSVPIDSAHPYSLGASFAAVTSPFFGDFVADSTDSRGRASVLIKLGQSTGAARAARICPGIRAGRTPPASRSSRATRHMW